MNRAQITRFDGTSIIDNSFNADDLHSCFERDGFLLIDNFATEAECVSLRHRADQIIDSFDAEAHQIVFSASGQSHAASDYFRDSASDIACFLEAGAVDEAGRLVTPKSQAVNKIGHALHDLDPVFAPFSRQEKVKQLVLALQMQEPLLLQSMVICKQPFIGGEVNSHQDSSFLYTHPESCIGLWLALEPATTDNGCMWAAKGGHQHRLQRRFHKQGDEMVMTSLRDDTLPPCDTPLEADAGTLVVLHGRLPHLSYENRSDRSRYAYALHLIDGACDYLADNWLQRPASFPLSGF